MFSFSDAPNVRLENYLKIQNKNTKKRSSQNLLIRAVMAELGIPTLVSEGPTLQHCWNSVLVVETFVGSRGSKVLQVEVSEV